ncbi:hypothetical protein SUGI_0971950 [Cryptomeria japonica]|nr:hypothetical protein SUGI_0971950 [Cryptomeria japonica]
MPASSKSYSACLALSATRDLYLPAISGPVSRAFANLHRRPGNYVLSGVLYPMTPLSNDIKFETFRPFHVNFAGLRLLEVEI